REVGHTVTPGTRKALPGDRKCYLGEWEGCGRAGAPPPANAPPSSRGRTYGHSRHPESAPWRPYVLPGREGGGWGWGRGRQRSGGEDGADDVEQRAEA